jgi:hypothetical protein
MEKVMLTITTVGSIFLGFFVVTEAIGRATVYTAEIKKEKMEVCLSEEVPYQHCYQAIYDKWTFDRTPER